MSIGRLRGLLDGRHNLSKDNFANPKGDECKTEIVDKLLKELSHYAVTCVIDISGDAGSSDIWFCHLSEF